MTENNKAANAVLQAAIKNVDGLLGRALRDGLLGLGIVYSLNASSRGGGSGGGNNAVSRPVTGPSAPKGGSKA